MTATAKKIWTLCLVLMVIFFGIILFQLNGSVFGKSKMISGVKTTLPKLESGDLNKLPQKNQNYQEPNVYANSAILIDEKSFYELYAKNAEQKVPIASTTKIMTALIVLEEYPDQLNEVVTVTSQMINVEGSDIQLRSGEKMTVENLLKGLLIMSGNDTAYSLAAHFGGKDDFVKKMNAKAVFLGLKNTQYKDPAGLDDEGYSTASDLAIIAAYAMRNQQFREIVRTPNANITSADGRILHELKNSNRMMRVEEQFYFPSAIGVKTGFTPAAGHCLVSAAEKDGHRIIAVILNTNENTLTASAKESKKLLEWGFNNWTW